MPINYCETKQRKRKSTNNEIQDPVSIKRERIDYMQHSINLLNEKLGPEIISDDEDGNSDGATECTAPNENEGQCQGINEDLADCDNASTSSHFMPNGVNMVSAEHSVTNVSIHDKNSERDQLNDGVLRDNVPLPSVSTIEAESVAITDFSPINTTQNNLSENSDGALDTAPNDGNHCSDADLLDNGSSSPHFEFDDFNVGRENFATNVPSHDNNSERDQQNDGEMRENLIANGCREYSGIDNSKIESLKKANMTDRQFLNKILEVVFTPRELFEGSAQGKISHGVGHKALETKRLYFVKSKYFVQ